MSRGLTFAAAAVLALTSISPCSQQRETKADLAQPAPAILGVNNGTLLRAHEVVTGDCPACHEKAAQRLVDEVITPNRRMTVGSTSRGLTPGPASQSVDVTAVLELVNSAQKPEDNQDDDPLGLREIRKRCGQVQEQWSPLLDALCRGEL